MGIAAFFSRSPLLSVLLAPLQALLALWLPAPPAASAPVFAPASLLRRSEPGQTQAATKNIAINNRHTGAGGSKTCQTVVKTSSPRRLKIVREMEAGISPACAGRMVISGRMADVCAELDRMVQREAAAQAA